MNKSFFFYFSHSQFTHHPIFHPVFSLISMIINRLLYILEELFIYKKCLSKKIILIIYWIIQLIWWNYAMQFFYNEKCNLFKWINHIYKREFFFCSVESDFICCCLFMLLRSSFIEWFIHGAVLKLLFQLWGLFVFVPVCAILRIMISLRFAN